MLDRNIAYGHNHLSTTLDKPVQDYEGLRRESERLENVPGSSYGGPLADPRSTRAARSQAVTGSTTVLEGVIHYAIPGTFTYRVIHVACHANLHGDREPRPLQVGERRHDAAAGISPRSRPAGQRERQASSAYDDNGCLRASLGLWDAKKEKPPLLSKSPAFRRNCWH